MKYVISLWEREFPKQYDSRNIYYKKNAVFKACLALYATKAANT